MPGAKTEDTPARGTHEVGPLVFRARTAKPRGRTEKKKISVAAGQANEASLGVVGRRRPWTKEHGDALGEHRGGTRAGRRDWGTRLPTGSECCDSCRGAVPVRPRSQQRVAVRRAAAVGRAKRALGVASGAHARVDGGGSPLVRGENHSGRAS